MASVAAACLSSTVGSSSSTSATTTSQSPQDNAPDHHMHHPTNHNQPVVKHQQASSSSAAPPPPPIMPRPRGRPRTRPLPQQSQQHQRQQLSAMANYRHTNDQEMMSMEQSASSSSSPPELNHYPNHNHHQYQNPQNFYSHHPYPQQSHNPHPYQEIHHHHSSSSYHHHHHHAHHHQNPMMAPPAPPHRPQSSQTPTTTGPSEGATSGATRGTSVFTRDIRNIRNQAEKQRRDKLNGYINDLANIVPFITLSKKRQDKTSILRLSAAYIRFTSLMKRWGKDGKRILPTGWNSGSSGGSAGSTPPTGFSSSSSSSSPSTEYSGCPSPGFSGEPSLMAHMLIPPKALPKKAQAIYSALVDTIDSLPGFSLITNCQGKILFVTPAIEKFLGHQDTDVIGNSLHHFLHPSDLESVLSAINSSLSQVSGGARESERITFDCRLKEKNQPRSDQTMYRSVRVSGHITRDFEHEPELFQRDSYSSRSYSSGSPGDSGAYHDSRYYQRSYSTPSNTARSYSYSASSSPYSDQDSLSYQSYQSSPGPSSLDVPPPPPQSNPSPSIQNFGSLSSSSSSAGLSMSNMIFMCFVEVIPTSPNGHELKLSDANFDEYISRHSLDGTLLYADHRIASVIGFFPSEVFGKSAYDYIIREDYSLALFAHKLMLSNSNGTGVVVHRLRGLDGSAVFLQTAGCLQYNSVGQIDHFMCVSRMLVEEEGEKERINFLKRFTPHIHNKSPLDLYESLRLVINPCSGFAPYSDYGESNTAPSMTAIAIANACSDLVKTRAGPARQLPARFAQAAAQAAAEKLAQQKQNFSTGPMTPRDLIAAATASGHLRPEMAAQVTAAMTSDGQVTDPAMIELINQMTIQAAIHHLDTQIPALQHKYEMEKQMLVDKQQESELGSKPLDSLGFQLDARSKAGRKRTETSSDHLPPPSKRSKLANNNTFIRSYISTTGITPQPPRSRRSTESSFNNQDAQIEEGVEIRQPSRPIDPSEIQIRPPSNYDPDETFRLAPGQRDYTHLLGARVLTYDPAQQAQVLSIYTPQAAIDARQRGSLLTQGSHHQPSGPSSSSSSSCGHMHHQHVHYYDAMPPGPSSGCTTAEPVEDTGDELLMINPIEELPASTEKDDDQDEDADEDDAQLVPRSDPTPGSTTSSTEEDDGALPDEDGDEEDDVVLLEEIAKRTVEDQTVIDDQHQRRQHHHHHHHHHHHVHHLPANVPVGPVELVSDVIQESVDILAEDELTVTTPGLPPVGLDSAAEVSYDFMQLPLPPSNSSSSASHPSPYSSLPKVAENSEHESNNKTGHCNLSGYYPTSESTVDGGRGAGFDHDNSRIITTLESTNPQQSGHQQQPHSETPNHHHNHRQQPSTNPHTDHHHNRGNHYHHQSSEGAWATSRDGGGGGSTHWFHHQPNVRAAPAEQDLINLDFFDDLAFLDSGDSGAAEVGYLRSSSGRGQTMYGQVYEHQSRKLTAVDSGPMIQPQPPPLLPTELEDSTDLTLLTDLYQPFRPSCAKQMPRRSLEQSSGGKLGSFVSGESGQNQPDQAPPQPPPPPPPRYQFGRKPLHSVTSSLMNSANHPYHPHSATSPFSSSSSSSSAASSPMNSPRLRGKILPGENLESDDAESSPVNHPSPRYHHQPYPPNSSSSYH